MKTRFTYVLAIFIMGYTLTVTSQEQKEKPTFKPEVKFGGRVHYDFEFLGQKSNITGVDDYSFNGNEFRAMYITASGSVAQNISFKAELDFANGVLGYRDVFIKYHQVPAIGGNLILGSQAEPTGMDMMASSNFIPFKERTPMTATQAFRWNSGIGYENYTILNGKIGLQATYGFNGKNTEGFTDKALENGAHFVARLFSPVFENKENNQVLHIGAHYENRKYTKDPANYNLKFRPENHMGMQTTIAFTDLKKQQDFGLELAAKHQSLYLQGEYEKAGYETVTNEYALNGYYAMVSYFITKDTKEYKEGVFGKVSPNRNFDFSEKSFGAVEVLARYSGFDYSNVVTTGNNDKVNSLAFGLNWYFNSNTRMMYNYVISDYHLTGDNPKLHAHLMRFQVHF